MDYCTPHKLSVDITIVAVDQIIKNFKVFWTRTRTRTSPGNTYVELRYARSTKMGVKTVQSVLSNCKGNALGATYCPFNMTIKRSSS